MSGSGSGGAAVAPRVLAEGETGAGLGWPARTGTRVRALVRRHRALVVVLLLYAASAAVVPTWAPVATTDDWAYVRSAEILLAEGRLVVFPVVAATAVFPAFWGALFGLLFGSELGAFRLSSVVMVGFGGVALYRLCQTLGVGRGRSALGAAAFLFNPLVYSLAFTFMTDPHFVSLLIIAAAGYSRGLEPGRAGRWAMVAGSVAAALAFLTRQQGALISPAVLACLLLAGQIRPNRAGAATVARVAGVPIATGLGYLLWLRSFNDVPVVQESFLRDALAEGWAGTWWLAERLSVVGLTYLGFFALPLVVTALPVARRLWRETDRSGGLLAGLWVALLGMGTIWFWGAGMRMPYVSQFFGSGGLGPPDVLGSRPRLFERPALDALTIVCVLASLALALVVARGIGRPMRPARLPAALVLAIGIGQVAGVLPPSYHYIGRTAGTLDRYLVPLVPIAIALTLWALRGVKLAPGFGWAVIAVFAFFSVAGTRDYLVFLDGVWGLAREANAAGVPNTKLDAGSAWDGYHLYEYGVAQGITTARSPRGSPWWVYFYAKATDSGYVVSSKPLAGFTTVRRRDYSSWLDRGETPLFLLRRAGEPWPPRHAGDARGATALAADDRQRRPFGEPGPGAGP